MWRQDKRARTRSHRPTAALRSGHLLGQVLLDNCSRITRILIGSTPCCAPYSADTADGRFSHAMRSATQCSAILARLRTCRGAVLRPFLRKGGSSALASFP